MARTLRDALSELDHEARKITQVEYYIYRQRNRERVFLAGTMYMWTGFRERAFAFASRDQAQSLIDEFPADLEGTLVGETVLTTPESN